MEIEPLRHAEAVAPLDERLRLGPFEREVILAVHALDVGDILEALGGDVDHRGATALQEGVGGDGGADADAVDAAGGDVAEGDGVHDGVDGAGRRGRRLGDDQLARLVVDADEIGEGAPRINPEPNWHPRSFLPWRTMNSGSIVVPR